MFPVRKGKMFAGLIMLCSLLAPTQAYWNVRPLVRYSPWRHPYINSARNSIMRFHEQPSFPRMDMDSFDTLMQLDNIFDNPFYQCHNSQVRDYGNYIDYNDPHGNYDTTWGDDGQLSQHCGCGDIADNRHQTNAINSIYLEELKRNAQEKEMENKKKFEREKKQLEEQRKYSIERQRKQYEKWKMEEAQRFAKEEQRKKELELRKMQELEKQRQKQREYDYQQKLKEQERKMQEENFKRKLRLQQEREYQELQEERKRQLHLQRLQEKRQSQRQSLTILELEVTGYYPDDIDITIKDKNIYVHGHHICDCTESCVDQEFQKVYNLPNDVDTDSVIASLDKKGLLKIEGVKYRYPVQQANTKIEVQGTDIPQKQNTTKCPKKRSGIKLAKMNARTGQLYEPEVYEFSNDNINMRSSQFNDDDVTLEVVDYNEL